MAHRHHSTWSDDPGQAVTTSSPATWVYMSMDPADRNLFIATNTSTGDSVVYEKLVDDDHYSFACRCGCGDLYAGFGRDIKTAATIETQLPELSCEESSPVTGDEPAEPTMKSRPFVSDRYIQKAIFDLTDEEIDAVAERRAAEGYVDPVIKHGGGAEDGDPPEVGKTVYSRVTRDGPYTVLDFTMAKIMVGDGPTAQIHQTWCAVLRTQAGNYIHLPVGDLVKMPPAIKNASQAAVLSLSARAKKIANDHTHTMTGRLIRSLGWAALISSVAGAIFFSYIYS